MDSIDNTDWDVLTAGTGLQESLLALALSRSGKRILHVDKNDYYGGADASFSLQEAEAWATDRDERSPFANKTLEVPEPTTGNANQSKLSFPRAYSLALAPQIIYSRSALLTALVSSRVDSQLEFLAVGSWWIYTGPTASSQSADTTLPERLLRIPSGREDIFADASLEPRAKRALMRFLRFITDYENQTELWEEYKTYPLSLFLLGKFALPPTVQRTLLALTLIPSPPSEISTAVALPRIARHLRSFGVFGPGFAAVIPKWGGLSELAQIGCRAGAVGGGTYVLANGLDQIMSATHVDSGSAEEKMKLKLKNGNTVTTQYLVASEDNLPIDHTQTETESDQTACRLICIISSPLESIFPPMIEGGPPPAAAIVVFPGTITTTEEGKDDTSQVYISVHSSDTGECPSGQSVLYGSVNAQPSEGFAMLNQSISNLLSAVDEPNAPSILWKLQYSQRGPTAVRTRSPSFDPALPSTVFGPPSLDLAFDDVMLDNVKTAWDKIVGTDGGDFLRFPSREGLEAADAEEE